MTTSVIPIPPSYNENEKLCIKDTQSYLHFLESENVQTVMTTAGTSQFGLLDTNEILDFNRSVSEFKGTKILGVPQIPTINLKQFISNSDCDDNTFFMGLYPDRFYDKKTIIEYFSRIRDYTKNPIYVHGMFMRAGRGGQWNFTSEVLCELFDKDIIIGIKEEHSDLSQAYNLVVNLPAELDVIVAGGSMRRHQFLNSAGANSFLSGVGNMIPSIENEYCRKIDCGLDVQSELDIESKLFSVFNKHGWHQSLRIALSLLQLCCFSDRMPWPTREESIVNDIENVLKGISQ